MNQRTIIIVTLGILLTILALRPVKTMAEGPSFAGVIPFATSAGSIGFFNQTNGKVYVYDGDLATCIFEGQFQELGKAVTKIHANSAKSYDEAQTK